ncbi:MAG: beta-ketoacyl-[acyl-carrier-protein] synthase family protein [Deltaproteobacteria bacterium]
MVRVIGTGARTPFGVGPAALLEGLCAARPAFVAYEPFARAGLKFPLAAAVPETVVFDPTLVTRERGARLLEGAVRDALEDATGARTLEGLASVPRERVALVAGTSSSGIGPFCAALSAGQPRPDDDARYASATHAVARALGVRGPVLVVCSVCASGALAIAEAAQMIASGDVDVAIAAGFDPLEPFVGAGFDSLNALCELPRPFRAGRRGLVLGEGSAALVLASDGVLPASRVRGFVRGWGESADAHHLTAPDPEGKGVARAIERAMACAGITRDDVAVVNAHGTGTPYNDAMESAALVRVFGARGGERPVYTVKGTIGHTLGAAGAIEAVVSLSAMEARIIPPTVTGGAPDPKCDLDLVIDHARRCDASLTLSMSSAFGGANCVLVLARGDDGAAR